MKKHILYCNPATDINKPNTISFNFEKKFDILNLPGKLTEYGRVKVTFEKFVPMKSNKQLGYYWSGILPYMEKELYTDTGLSKDDWHNELKDRFGIKEEDKSGNFTKKRSHALYSEKEMAFFITQVINWVRDFFQLQVPGPTVIDEYI